MTTDETVDPPRICVADRAIASAEANARKASPREMGGILVGWWEGDRTAIVLDVLAIPDHCAGHNHYERRYAAAQRILDEYLRSGTRVDVGYVGEWHSHPAPQPPSSIDRAALSSIARQARHPVALLVLSLVSACNIYPHGLIGRPRWPRRAAIEPALVERM